VIAVIGAGGQLGRELCTLLGPNRVVPLTHADVEIASSESLLRVLQPIAPQVVVNTAAFNHVDDAESQPAAAFQVNSLGVRELAHVCKSLGATLLHFSTDYVFGIDSSRDRPYEVADAPGPVNVYGLSKLAGEYFLRIAWPNHFIIRTCGLYGTPGQGGKGRNFVQTMLRLGRERGAVRVVDDQRCTPTSAADLASATVPLLNSREFGTYHWTNSGSCTWFEFAEEIFRQSGLTVRCEPITSAQFGAAAARPLFSVLSTEAYQRLGLPAPRAWQEALRDYLKELRVES
jgi:dTDP-4-dehydrorhamnose reductase